MLPDDLDMMMVVTVDPLHLQHGAGPCRLEKASLNLVANLVDTLPAQRFLRRQIPRRHPVWHDA